MGPARLRRGPLCTAAEPRGRADPRGRRRLARAPDLGHRHQEWADRDAPDRARPEDRPERSVSSLGGSRDAPVDRARRTGARRRLLADMAYLRSHRSHPPAARASDDRSLPRRQAGPGSVRHRPADHRPLRQSFRRRLGGQVHLGPETPDRACAPDGEPSVPGVLLSPGVAIGWRYLSRNRRCRTAKRPGSALDSPAIHRFRRCDSSESRLGSEHRGRFGRVHVRSGCRVQARGSVE
jgi:hypothetical protein